MNEREIQPGEPRPDSTIGVDHRRFSHVARAYLLEQEAAKS